MQFKKVFLSFTVFYLTLPSSLMGQSVVEVVQARKKNGVFRMQGRLFALPASGIKSLDGIEQIPGIARAWSLALSGNDVEIVKANTFNHPQFKNLHALDLSNNKISSVEPGALNGLESLNFLWLSGNQLMSIPDGALSALNKNKNLFVFVGNNPGGKELLKQVKKQLPKASVYSRSMKQEVLKATALGAGIVAAIVGVVLAGRYAYERSRPVYGPLTAEQAALKEIAQGALPSSEETREIRARIVSAEELLKTIGQNKSEIQEITQEYLRHPDFSIEAQFLAMLLSNNLFSRDLPQSLQETSIGKALKLMWAHKFAPNLYPKDLLQNTLAIEAIIFAKPENERAKKALDFLWAEAGNKNVTVDIVKLLLKHGALLPTGGQETVLNHAILYDNKVVATTLIEAGADVNAANVNGETPLHMAAELKTDDSRDVTQKLLDKGANVNAANVDGNTPLHKAATYSSLEVIQKLLDKDANINAVNNNGETPLYRAGNQAAIQALLDKGANINAVTNNGTTALDYANLFRHSDVREFLRSRGALTGAELRAQEAAQGQAQ